MRDSDIKDEFGRSAEQIAAEAAQEFDIDSVVRKAASMPDAPDQPVRPKTSLISPASFPKHKADKSRIHVQNDAPVVAQAAPEQAAPEQAPQPQMTMPEARPVTQVFLTTDPAQAATARPVTQVFQAAELPAAAPARPATRVFQVAEDALASSARPVSQILSAPDHQGSTTARPVSQVLASPAETHPPSARPVSRVIPALEQAPEPAAAKSKPLELSESKRIEKPKSKLEISNGHILQPGPSQEAIIATEDAREAYWEALGESDEELLSYPISPELRGMPAWPTQLQAFRVVRTPHSVIIASEGLSDAFGPFDTRTGVNGFGLEFYIEVVGWQSMIPVNLHKTWAFRAVEHAARLAAHAENLVDLLENEVLSMDLPQNCVPKGWVVPGMAEPAGALLGVPQPPGRGFIKDMPLSKVKVIPITPIFPEELESCVLEGPGERRALANDLLTTGAGHRADMDRTSLR
ncbi:MAG: hypothetical protein AAF340_07640 [Pseudomonadota bacterium]